MHINIAPLEQPPVAALPVEVVERKGLGHPDSICDALAERLSLALCRFYRDHAGLILHHNVDKVLLCGGEAQPAFRGGRIVKPIDIILSGRATTFCEGVRVPLRELAEESAVAWLRENLHALDAARDVRIEARVRPGSQELVSLFRRSHQERLWLANDTSCGIGFAPFSPLETVVYRVERLLTAPETIRDQPVLGEDVKVMGVRQDGRIALTVASALIGRHLDDLAGYLRTKEAVAELVRQEADRHTDMPVAVSVNAADDPAAESIYLTVSGTSAEAGDDGEAGRGNRVNGLITPYRPMTLESVAGKNPVTHVGKLYNLAAGLIADRLVREVPRLESVHCVLVSRIGQPITEPQIVDLRARPAIGAAIGDFSDAMQDIVTQELERLPDLAEALLDGRLGIDRWPLTAGPGTC